jgi:hypothetical protein
MLNCCAARLEHIAPAMHSAAINRFNNHLQPAVMLTSVVPGDILLNTSMASLELESAWR